MVDGHGPVEDLVAMPSVSIVVPVRNGMPYIERALSSVLEQDVDDVEIIVRENGSTDGTADWLNANAHRGFDVRVAPHPCSAAENWTEAVRSASGDFVKLLCADDAIAPGGLKRQLDALRAHPNAVMVASRRRVLSAQGDTVIPHHGMRGFVGEHDGIEAATRAAYSGTNPFGEPSAVLFRREAMVSALPFREEYPYVTDLEFYVRVLQSGTLLGLKSTDAEFRLSATSWSSEIGRGQLDQYRRWVAAATAEGLLRPTASHRLLAEPRFTATYTARRLVSRLSVAKS